jgi:hypothetical protein
MTRRRGQTNYQEPLSCDKVAINFIAKIEVSPDKFGERYVKPKLYMLSRG